MSRRRRGARASEASRSMRRRAAARRRCRAAISSSVAGERVQAVHAGPALARALAGQPARDARGFGDRACAVGEQQHDARAERRAVRRRGARWTARRRASRSRRDPGAGVAADERSARPARSRRRRRRSASDSEAPCSISYTPGCGDRAGQRDERRAGLRGACRAARNQSAPWRAISATWASVSTLLTSVGPASDALFERAAAA